MTQRGVAVVPLVSIVVPVKNGADCIGPCITSLLRTRYPNDRREILVVDNGSTDRTADIIRKHPVRYLFEARTGPSYARNRGIEASRGQVLAFIDADCAVTTRWLAELVSPFERAEVSGVAGEILSFPAETRAQRYMAMRKSRWQKPAVESASWPFAVTANVAFRRDTFERIGLFDPLLVRGQDKDLGRRFLDAALTLEYAPRAVVFHRHRETARGFFQQHLGWGFGAALLHVKYGLRWGFRHEAVKYGELLGSVWELGKSGLRHLVKGGEEMDFYYPYFEVLRRIAHRAGLVKGLVWRVGRGWNRAWPETEYPKHGGGQAATGKQPSREPVVARTLES